LFTFGWQLSGYGDRGQVLTPFFQFKIQMGFEIISAKKTKNKILIAMQAEHQAPKNTI
jgi:hypothetical protein